MGFIQRISDALLPRDVEEQASSLTSPFDSIREFDGDGNEYWSARKLMKFMGYAHWETFGPVIEKAIEAVANNGYQPGDHFEKLRDSIPTGKGPRIQVDDVHLDRFACYHVALAGDPSKRGVAAARSYFVIQTRRSEVRDAEERQAAKIGKTAKSAQKKNGLEHDLHYGLTRQDAVDVSNLIAAIFFKVFGGDRRMIAGGHNAIYQALTGLTAAQLQAKYGFKDTPLNHLETALLAMRNSLGALIAQGVEDGTITPDNAYEKVQSTARAFLAVPRAIWGTTQIVATLSPTGQTLLGIRPMIATNPSKQLNI